MKKVLLFASALTVGFASMAQMNTSLYKVTGCPLNVALNDTANKYYQVTNLDTKKVNALSIVDSAAIKSGKLYWPTTQFDIKAENNAWVVKFDRVNGVLGDNYTDFNYKWVSWVDKTGKAVDKPTKPFPYAAPTGTVAAPVFTPVASADQDTLRGYLVDLSSEPVVYLKAKSDKKTNIRIDLIDKNNRISNTLAPHHWLPAGEETVLEFRWDKTKADGITVDWKYEDAVSDDFNIGCAVDGWAGDWWGLNFGRNTPEGGTPSPFLGGKNAWDGAIMLDLSSIAGLAFHVEDGTITKDHELDTLKTITISKIIVGNADKAVHLESNAVKPTFSYVGAKEVSGDINFMTTIGEDKSAVAEVTPTLGTTFNVTE